MGMSLGKTHRAPLSTDAAGQALTCGGSRMPMVPVRAKGALLSVPGPGLISPASPLLNNTNKSAWDNIQVDVDYDVNAKPETPHTQA